MKILFVSAALLSVVSFGGPIKDKFSSVSDYMPGVDSNAYYMGLGSLEKQFNEDCGDTFCEGDYSNLTPLSFDCSVENATGKIQSCVWLFAGSYAQVDAESGKLKQNEKFFRCDLKIKGTDFKDLMAYLREVKAKEKTVDALVDVKLPGRNVGAWDVLQGCLN